jgi:transcriptional regulator with XRE-family HTH domain
MMDIVLKLRELRRLRGLTQKEAAESSGIGEKTLSSFETGERLTSLKVSQLLQLLSAYDMTPAEFFGDGVERKLFGEFADLVPTEMKLLTAWRALPEHACQPLAERFLLMMDGAVTVSSSHLRAVR